RGVTPAGDHVWLFSEEEPIETMLKSTLPGPIEFDLWIVVNDKAKTSTKLTLRAIALMTSEDADPVSNFRTPHDLYLGRYRHEGDSSLNLVNRPMPRRLSSFGTSDEEAWRSWVAPLHARLSEVLKEHGSLDLTRPARVAAGVEITRLAFEWHSLPIPIL